jgi:uncharacterized protein (DUF924 family)
MPRTAHESWLASPRGRLAYVIVLDSNIVHRFGRFPHRNAVLGRASTPEEIEFGKQPESLF